MKIIIALSHFALAYSLDFNWYQPTATEDVGPVQHIPAESRIVGGQEADPGEYPFFVHWDGCGASLIHEDVVLTAAHCNGIFTTEMYVGAYIKNSLAADAERRFITERRQHPSYNSGTVAYDYMVMKLDQPVTTIEPIPLNENPNNPTPNELLTVMGFGTTSEGGFTTQTLREVDLNYVDQQTCNNQYGGSIIEDIMMCAAADGGGKDSCQGDSGGPIIERQGNGFRQVGIVSWGIGCGRPDYAGVYSRISGEIDWIKSQICDLAQNPPSDCGNGGGSGGGGGGGSGNGTPAPGLLRIRIDVTYDEYSSENSWSLVQGDGGKVAEFQQGTLDGKNGLVRYWYDVAPGVYEFRMDDSYGDGICCAFGLGSVDIYQVKGSSNILLASSDGKFGNQLRLGFEMRNDDATQPRPTPNQTPGNTLASCEDSGQDLFLVDSNVGEKGCTWLRDSMDRFNYLCQFVDVALTCPVLCEICDLI